MAKRVGILALQGGVAEHEKLLQMIPDITPVWVKKPKQLEGLSALIIPGGESTTIGKLIRQYGFIEPLKQMHAEKKPLWGTCAGLILLAKEVEAQADAYLGLIDITVKRNAFGSQLNSFIANQKLDCLAGDPMELVFIRAPIITRCGPNVKVLSTVGDSVVAAEEGNVLVTSFHPELTDDPRIHEYFVRKIGRS